MAEAKRPELGQPSKLLKFLFIFFLAAAAPLVLNLVSAQAQAAGAWAATGSLATARIGHTATLLPNGKVLVAGGVGITGGSRASAEIFDPSTETWVATGNLNTARHYHTATLLPNGKVLVTGGYNNASYSDSAELFDPAANTGIGAWTTIASLSTVRVYHTATLLPNGKVLVAGGYDAGGLLASAEIFDPAAGTWTATGSLNNARAYHTATLLPNGKALVAAGDGGGVVLVSAELFDPAANGGLGAWTGTGSLNTGRVYHTATLLPNGKVLVAGGQDDNTVVTASAEVFDPAANGGLGAWTGTGSLSIGRNAATATLLPNGKVLAAGGSDGSNLLATAELYDLHQGAWRATGDLDNAHGCHTAILLPNGKVLVAGGEDSYGVPVASAELYATPQSTWTAAAGTWVYDWTWSLQSSRMGHTATLLPNGKVMAAGGWNSSDLVSAELYDPVTRAWTATGDLSGGRSDHTATLLPNGKVLVVGGSSASSHLASAELYDPAANSGAGAWTATASLTTGRSRHTATLLPNGKVLVAGGRNSGGNLASAEIFDPAGNSGVGSWTATGNLSNARRSHTATILPNGKVLAAGGYGDSGDLASAEIFDPAGNSGAGSWTATGNLGTARTFHTATLLPNGKVLVAGGTNETVQSSAEIFDPDGNYGVGAWTATGSLTGARYLHTATLLPNGQVLAAGGYGSSYLTSAEIFDPAGGTWVATGSLNEARRSHTATLLPNGLILAAGGYDSGPMNSSELYGKFYTVTATAGTGGSISPAGTVKVEDGMDQTFTITRDPEYHVSDVTVDGASLGAVTSHTIQNVTDDKTIAASFAPGGWAANSTLTTGRYYHTATLLPNGKVLAAGGWVSNSAELYDPAAVGGMGAWTATGSLATGRGRHTATLLPNGKVLVAGGRIIGASLTTASAELFDPAANGGLGAWTAAASLNTSRMDHTATLLPNGKVLVAGGANVSSYLASAELYDPDTDTWTSTGDLVTARENHTATLLPNGKILVAGGLFSGASVTNTAELFDPAANGGAGAWTATGPLATARYYHTATLLANGKVLVAGGQGVTAAELYDPAAGTWSPAGSISSDRYLHTATLLPNGQVLIAGGYGNIGLVTHASSEVYDPGNNNWAPTSDFAVSARQSHTATLLSTGRVLAAGGTTNGAVGLNSAELYGPPGATIYKIAATAGAHGVIWPCGPVLVGYGANQTFTITPRAGYRVADVVVDGVSQGPVTTYTNSYVMGNSTIQATFAVSNHTITATAGTGGSISPSGAVSVTDGGSQTFTITPNPGYHITNVTVDGVSQGAVSSYPFTNVTADRTIAASFAPNTYTLTASAGPGGTISPAGAMTVNYGASQTYSITPNTGYHLANVVVDGVSQGPVSSYSFNNITASHTITASFAINTNTITASAGANGSISPSGAVSVNYGASQTFNITPATGHHVADVAVDRVSVGPRSSYTFNNVTANHTIAAKFALDTFTITATAGANGSISPAGAVSVNYGASQAFTITPATGYHIADVLVDGVSQGPVSSFTFNNVTANHAIAASFALDTFTITASAGAGGSISPAGAVAVNHGASQAFTITPNTGYHLADVLVDGVSQGPVSSFTFNNVTANHAIAASFAINTFTINASAGEGGRIGPGGAVPVPPGASQTFIITPFLGKRIAEVLVDGASVGPVARYTFSNVTGNHTIAAQFTTDWGLTFPLPDYTPNTAPVGAVMDNSVLERSPIEFYVPGEVIKAFNGETGAKQYGMTYLDPYGLYWQAYKNSTGTDFFPANEAGARPLNYLNGPWLSYAGMPGYNYHVPPGTPVLATAAGKLYKAETDPVNGAGYSYYYNSYIDHQNGYYSWYLYAPLSPAILAEIGQNGYAQVTRGQVIGQTTGDRLHFEVRYQGFGHANVVDPYKLELWLQPKTKKLGPWLYLLLID